MTALESIQELKTRMSASIIGQDALIERIILVLLANGNMLLEGLPGLAKTRAIKTLAKELDCGLSRIQFTPDLLPSDVTGTEIYQPESAEKFLFQKGPIFSNLILADEINRSPAKVQSALLEAMEERQVSVAGKTYPMDPLFMVMATQNPVEQEGTYPLPEAQMDRFLMHVIISYPDDASELKILRLNREEQHAAKEQEHKKLSPEVVFEARKEIAKVKISEAMEKYIVDIISATRYPDKYNKELDAWVDFGASPRGSIAIDRAARTHAWMQGKDFVEADNVRAIVHDCLRHRLILSYEANAEGVTPDMVLTKILEEVAVLA
ncbi:AAA family ATPase [Roseivirga pacifica]|uniref:AAA family ATPase n=1 Tax=Roseivirga pacifica TaxID=1267423 RepID=UPI002094484F|nr:AAA family ATPase [Roseivirga pacifica]MCO6358689.1 AAA domain-containing protein [Roseivirga pacifica]MCO6365675.1 AAA domain-containing protein [Roseivirga pacifica]MCO6371595.1 AAA domain-containing protein [Roseivirga pacifica]MCO6376294.1 AAA domain-containing protein [Roseivirga pacifica]MCO6378973.1 AAA domain-containing protein [Roseivirga pacifica]